VPDSRVVLCCDVGPGARGGAPNKYRSLHELLGERAPAERFETDPTATVFMFYSSGTTGLPKGVESTHFNLTTQMQTAGAHLDQCTPQDRILGFLPMSHMYGAMMFLLYPLRFGCAAVILPKFDEIAVYKAIQDYRCTIGIVVPPVLVLWASSPHFKKYDLSSLRSLTCGAAPLSPDLARRFYKLLPVPICEAYGMTECSPGVILMDSSMATPERIGWCGRLIPSYQARLVRDDGSDAPLGSPGELWVRGPNVMKGYKGRTGDILPGGWFRTGDVMLRDKHGW
jgi:acyl-CoA synthetase (AMP-forming)/AMP-acid ligase II